MSQSKLDAVCEETPDEPETVVTEDGREMQIPDTVQFDISIGRKTRMDKGYVTDEMMTVNSPAGWLVGEEIPNPLRRYIQNPQLETDRGDIRVWECPAGQFIRPEKLKSILEKEDGVEIDYIREDEGRHDETRISLQVKTEAMDIQ